MRSDDRVFYNRNPTTASYVKVCDGIIYISQLLYMPQTWVDAFLTRCLQPILRLQRYNVTMQNSLQSGQQIHGVHVCIEAIQMG